MAVKLNNYRVYGRDDDGYAFGGPLFGPVFLGEYKGRTQYEAIRKFYRRSQRKHLGWRLFDLTAKAYNRRTRNAKKKRKRSR